MLYIIPELNRKKENKFYAFVLCLAISNFIFISAACWLLLLFVGRVLAFYILKDKCVAGKIYIFLAFGYSTAKLSTLINAKQNSLVLYFISFSLFLRRKTHRIKLLFRTYIIGIYYKLEITWHTLDFFVFFFVLF